MKMHMFPFEPTFCRKLLRIFLPLSLLFSLCACSTNEDTPPEDAAPIVLRIVTERTFTDGMNSQLSILAEQFQSDNSNVTLDIAILPYEKTERDATLMELRAQTASGKGPDIYLLPTTNVIATDITGETTYTQVSPLFPNIPSAMREGYFSDISCYYNSDHSIQKDALVPEVMESGILGDARYILPLRYNIQALYVYTEELIAAGIDPTILEGSFLKWMQYAASTKDPLIACGAEYTSLNVFSDLIEHDTGKTALTNEEIAQYIAAIAQVHACIGDEYQHRSQLTLLSYGFDNWKHYPIHIDHLANAMNHAAIAVAEGKQLDIYPIRTTSGDTVATVTYYGAVDKNCKYPEVAYSFLRLFLTEESQWEQNRPEADRGESRELIEKGWPVLTSGSLDPLWRKNRDQAMTLTGMSPKLYQLRNIDLTEESLSIFHQEIDIVRFPIAADSLSLLNSLNHSDGSLPSDAQCRQVAEEFLNSFSAEMKNMGP